MALELQTEAQQITPGESAEGVLSRGVELSMLQAEGLELKQDRPSFLTRARGIMDSIVATGKNNLFPPSEPLFYTPKVDEALNERLKEIRENLASMKLERHSDYTASTLAD